MSTGFSDTEYRLSKLVGQALKAGVPESAYGIGGRRTVGPVVTFTGNGYQINGENGVVLGRTLAAARDTIVAIYNEHLNATTRKPPVVTATDVAMVQETGRQFGQKIGSGEARQIARLLKGRH
jgi:hypothetical protein